MHLTTFSLPLISLFALTTSALALPAAPPISQPGAGLTPGSKLRILPIGDSITFGSYSSDGNGYRLQLFNDLSAFDVTFAGTQHSGTMQQNLMEGYPGHTIQYIGDRIQPALKQGPNIVLIMAGTNDMSPDPDISKQGSNPAQAAQRLSRLVDNVVQNLPDAAVLVAQLSGVNDNQQQAQNTAAYNDLIPGLVESRRSSGKQVALVDMRPIQGSLIRPGDVHPTNAGYDKMGDIWSDAVRALPKDWVRPPVGPDPIPLPSGSRESLATGAETAGSCPLRI